MDLDPVPLNSPTPPDGDQMRPSAVHTRAALGIEVLLCLSHVLSAKTDKLRCVADDLPLIRTWIVLILVCVRGRLQRPALWITVALALCV